jgi:hypothetical protein
MSASTNTEDYFESFSTFYDEKLKFQANPDMKCGGCPTKKVFKETYEEITLSCGGKDKDEKCGMKLHIKFPKYEHYEKDMKLLKNELERETERLNLGEINKKHFDVKDSIPEETQKRKGIEEHIQKITDKFNQLNVENKKKDQRIQQSIQHYE